MFFDTSKMFVTSPAPSMHSSSSRLGSPSLFRQSQNPGDSQFPPKPFGSPTAFGAPTGGSIFDGTSTGVFGATSSSTSSTSFLGSSMPAFGASSTPGFGCSSSSFGGTQATAPTFASPSSGQSAFVGQLGGSRVASYTRTPEEAWPQPDGWPQPAGFIVSISAMPIHKDKSTDELRWEDYQLGDKGSMHSSSSTFGSPSLFAQSQNPDNSQFPPKPFGSPTAFGAPTGGSIFDGTSTGVFGATSSSTSSTLFLGSSMPTFSASSPSFGCSSSSFGGTQATAPTFASTGSGQSAFVGQRGGSRVASYTRTPEAGWPQLVVSISVPISAMPIYNDKSTDELRWDDYQLGDKGSQATAPTFANTGFQQSVFGGQSGESRAGSSIFGQKHGFGASSTKELTFDSTPTSSHRTIGFGSSSLFRTTPSPFANPSSPFGSHATAQKFANTAFGQSAFGGQSGGSGVASPIFGQNHAFGASSTHGFGYGSSPTSGHPTTAFDYCRIFGTTPSPFGTQSSATGSQATAPTFASTGFGQLAFGGQRGGSRVASYTRTTEADCPQPVGTLASISAMPIYKDKSNDELRLEDCQLGDKGENSTSKGRRAGEAAVACEHGADVTALMPKLHHCGYYTEPPIQELAAKERTEPGFCSRVRDFVVGRVGYGCIKFLGETDVRQLDLDSQVQFNNHEVVVYMDKHSKPPLGQGLNKPAEVTLFNIKCVDKKTGKQYITGPAVDKYRELLIKAAAEQGSKFVSFDPIEGEWKFRVPHFSQ